MQCRDVRLTVSRKRDALADREIIISFEVRKMAVVGEWQPFLFGARNAGVSHAFCRPLSDSYAHYNHIVGLVFSGAAPLLVGAVQHLALLVHGALVYF